MRDHARPESSSSSTPPARQPASPRRERAPERGEGGLLLRISAWIAAVALALLLWRAAPIFLLTFVGLLLAVFVRALARITRRLTPLSGHPALAAALVGLAAFTGLAAWLIAPALLRQLALLTDTLPDALAALQRDLAATALGQELLRQMPALGLPFTAADVLAGAAGVFSTTLSVLAYGVFVFFVAVFLAVHPRRYRDGLIRLAPPAYRPRAREVAQALAATLRAWIVGRALAMLIVGLTWAWGCGCWACRWR